MGGSGALRADPEPCGQALRAIIKGIVLIVTRPFRSFVLMLSLGTLGCHAQAPAAPGAAGDRLPAELSRRVEVMIRSKASVPANYVIHIGARQPSDIPGYSQILVSFAADGKTSAPVAFLISADGKTLAQFSKYDIAKDPRTLVSDTGRPARGGPENAPVVIVGFDDLECPYCAKLHAQLFPAITERYGKQVRIVYRDFPLDQHPWAMRAAVDANCVGAQSTPGYWTMVDNIHAHAGEFGGTDKSLPKANEQLDQLARDQAKQLKLDAAALESCVKKQDDGAIKASMKVGEDLGITATPVLFINGEKLEGAYPLEDVFRMIDGALVASGQTPPPPYKPAATAPKPGS